MSDAPRLWFDVEDLFDFAERNARPTGIQRVCYEIYRAALADPVLRERVGFVRHAADERGFVEADWDMLQFRFRRVTESPAEAAPTAVQSVIPVVVPDDIEAGEAATDVPPVRRALPVRLARRAGEMVPKRIAKPGFLFAVMQAQAGRALADTVGLFVAHRARNARDRAVGRVRDRLRRLPGAGLVEAMLTARPGEDRAVDEAPVPMVARRLAEIAQRGDVLVVLGSPWFEQEYAELASAARGRLGLRLAVLVHDVIPVRRPEWVDRGTVRVYRNWYRTVLPLADLVVANSHATAADLERWCADDNIALPGRVLPLPLGTGFGTACADIRPAQIEIVATGLPVSVGRELGGRPYVLFVSTIEARKNHMLLFRVWRRLLSDMPKGRVPDLVFAGRVGWLVDDLMNQITNSRHLDGHLHVVRGLDDASLKALYGNCLFTVFPSFYEGWGLPVSESLAMGQPCICSNATSLPEAGGTLARYFDPSDLNDAVRVIRETIEDAAGLVEWRARVVREFKPVGWAETAAALVRAADAIS